MMECPIERLKGVDTATKMLKTSPDNAKTALENIEKPPLPQVGTR
jgi:hypothetical protein